MEGLETLWSIHWWRDRSALGSVQCHKVLETGADSSLEGDHTPPLVCELQQGATCCRHYSAPPAAR